MRENPQLDIQPASASDVPELAPLFDAYRVFYQENSTLAESEAFVRRLIADGKTRFFLARALTGGTATGFVHLIPAYSTVAMRPMWYLEDLFVASEYRGAGVATTLMRHAEAFARQTGAERLTLATAHNNKNAQSLYKKLGYVQEDHFWYYHRILE